MLVTAAAIAAVVGGAARLVRARRRRAAGTRLRTRRGVPGRRRAAADTAGRKLRKSVRCLNNGSARCTGSASSTAAAPCRRPLSDTRRRWSQTDCLAHRCGGEVELEDRLRQAGYFANASSWSFAENTGCAVSAEAMVAGWMDVRFHRINILDKEFGDLGVGVVHKRIEDRCDAGFVTFAVVFGDRTP